MTPWIGLTSYLDLSSFIFWQLRAPRVLTGIAVGATLGLTGAAFQALFGNPLATPSTTGTTAGASLGALCALLLFPNVNLEKKKHTRCSSYLVRARTQYET